MPSASDIAAAALKSSTKAAFATKAKLVTHVDKDKRKDVVLALHQATLNVIAPKGNKVETILHILDVTAVNAVTHSNEQAVRISTMTQELLLSNFEAQPAVFATAIYALLRRIFPHSSLSNVIRCNIPAKIPRVSTEKPTPCGGFVGAFKVACDYHNISAAFPGLEDIIERYHTSRQREFVADDFHLLQDSFAPALITALMHNSWFTSVVIDNIKLTNEALEALVALVGRTCHVQRLTLKHIQADSKFWGRLAQALGANRRQSISHINFADNNLGDQVVADLASSIETLILGVRELRLPNVCMSAKGAAALARALKGNKRSATSLQIIDLANNQIGQDGVNAVLEFLGDANVVSEIDVSGSGCFLEPVLVTLGTSIFEHLARLCLRDCKFSQRKTSRLQPNGAAFFQRSACLTHLDLSGCKLPSDALKVILAGLADNPLLSNVTLNLSRCELGADDAAVDVIHHTLARLVCVTTLDISTNDFGDTALAKLIGAASSNSKTLQRLNVSHNLAKAKTAEKTLMALRTLFEGALGISELDLSYLKLKADLCTVLPSLGHNRTVKWLDISGNMLGDNGVREVATMLHYNQCLEDLRLDHNGMSETGLRELSAALRTNKTLKRMPLPLADLGSALAKAPPSLLECINSVQEALAQNHSPSRHLSASKNATVAESSSSKARLLATLVDQVNSVCEDGQVKEDALNNASVTVRASGTVFKVQRELEETVTGELAHKFADFGGDLAASLSSMLSTSVHELYAATEAATGESLEDLFRPTEEDHDTLCRELVMTAVADSACQLVMNAAAQQVSTAAENVTDYIVNRAVQRLRAILIARDASSVENVEELPEIKRARQQSGSMRISDFTKSLDVKNEAPIGFELPPADAGKASNNPQLHHAGKARPRHAGRRPPSRQRKPRGSGTSSVASTSTSSLAKEAAKATPTPAPRKPPTAAPRVALRPPPPNRSPPKRTSVVDEEDAKEGAEQAASAPQPKPRPAPPSRPPLTKSRSAAPVEVEGKKKGLLGRMFNKSASAKSLDLSTSQGEGGSAAGGEAQEVLGDEKNTASSKRASAVSSKRTSVVAEPLKETDKEKETKEEGQEKKAPAEAPPTEAKAQEAAVAAAADSEEGAPAKEKEGTAAPKGVVGGVRVLIPPSALKSTSKVHSRLSASLDEGAAKEEEEQEQEQKEQEPQHKEPSEEKNEKKKAEAEEDDEEEKLEAQEGVGARGEAETQSQEEQNAAQVEEPAGFGGLAKQDKKQDEQQEPEAKAEAAAATEAQNPEEGSSKPEQEEELPRAADDHKQSENSSEAAKKEEEEVSEAAQEETATAQEQKTEEHGEEKPQAGSLPVPAEREQPIVDDDKNAASGPEQAASTAEAKEARGDTPPPAPSQGVEEKGEEESGEKPAPVVQEAQKGEEQADAQRTEQAAASQDGAEEKAADARPEESQEQQEEQETKAVEEVSPSGVSVDGGVDGGGDAADSLPPPPAALVSEEAQGDGEAEDSLPPPPPPAGKVLSDTSLLGETNVDRGSSKASLTQDGSRTSVLSTEDDAWGEKPPVAAEKPAASPDKPATKPRPAPKAAVPPPPPAKSGGPPPPAPKPKPKPKPPVRPKSTASKE